MSGAAQSMAAGTRGGRDAGRSSLLTWWPDQEEKNAGVITKSRYNLPGPVPSDQSLPAAIPKGLQAPQNSISGWGPSVQTWESAEGPFTFKPQHMPSISPHLSREKAPPAYTGRKASVNAS